MTELVFYGSVAVLLYYYLINVLFMGLLRWHDWHWWYRNIYLNSFHWKIKRWQKKFSFIVQRKAVACESCGSRKYLQIHHITYKHLYREPLGDLQIICRSCHRKGGGKI